MPRNRNQPAVIVPLTVEQETTLGGFGNLLTGEPGESNLETLVRLFGSAEAAAAAWFDHRDTVLVDDPVAGRRPCGFWLFERGCEPPPVVEQAAILREIGELTEAEESQLEEWRAPRPAIPADLGIDHVTTITIHPTPEDTHANDGDIDAAPEPARPEATIEASTEDEAVEAEAGVPETPVTPPRILPMRLGIDDRKPAEVTGWESHDA